MWMLSVVCIGIILNSLASSNASDDLIRIRTAKAETDILRLNLTQKLPNHYIISSSHTSAIAITLNQVFIGNGLGGLSSKCQANYVMIYDSEKSDRAGLVVCGQNVQDEWKDRSFCSSNVSVKYFQKSSIDFGFNISIGYREVPDACHQNSCDRKNKCVITDQSNKQQGYRYKCQCLLDCEDKVCPNPAITQSLHKADGDVYVLPIDQHEKSTRRHWVITSEQDSVIIVNMTIGQNVNSSTVRADYVIQIFESDDNIYVVDTNELLNGVIWISRTNNVTLVCDHPPGDNSLIVTYYKESLKTYEKVKASSEIKLLQVQNTSHNVDTGSVWLIASKTDHYLHFSVSIKGPVIDGTGNGTYVKFSSLNRKSVQYSMRDLLGNATETDIHGDNVTVECFPSRFCLEHIIIKVQEKPLRIFKQILATKRSQLITFVERNQTDVNVTYVINITAENKFINIDIYSNTPNMMGSSTKLKIRLNNGQVIELARNDLLPRYMHSFNTTGVVIECHSTSYCHNFIIGVKGYLKDFCKKHDMVAPFSLDLFSWPDSPISTYVRLPCPEHFIGDALRYCKKDGTWDKTDYTGCISREIKLISDETHGISRNEMIDPDVFNNLTARLKTATASGRSLYPGDLPTVSKTVNILAGIVKNTSAQSTGLTSIAQGYGEAVDNIVDKALLDVWTYTSEDFVRTNMLLILKSLESLSANVAKKKLETMHKYKREITAYTQRDTVHVTAKNLEFDISFHERLAICEDSTVMSVGDDTASQVTLSSSVFKAAVKYSTDRFIQIYTARFSSVSEFIDDKNTIPKAGQVKPFINTEIVSSRVLNIPEERFQHLSKAVVVLFELKNKTEISGLKERCVFLNMSADNSNNTWTSEGCSLDPTRSNSTHVACKCIHLTNFAVLMDIYEIQDDIDDTDYTILTYITYIGGVMSVFACIITVIVFQSFSLRKERVLIHQQLAISIILSQVFFLVGIDRTENKYVCTVMAAMMQFSIMSMFCWMLVEGVHLYVMLVKVFRRRRNFRKYLIFGWGFPLVIVGVSVGLLHDQYGGVDRCWLSHNVLLWTFVPPVGLVLLVNSVILGIVLRIMIKSMLSRANSEERVAIKAGLKAAAILLPLLGITWTFGFMSVNSRETLVFTYLFTACNSLQGVFFFLFHCLLNTDVRNAFERRSQRRSQIQLLKESLGQDSRSKKSSTLNTPLTSKSSINSVLTDDTYLDKKKSNKLSNNDIDRIHRDHVTALLDRNYHFGLQRSFSDGIPRWHNLTKEYTFYNGKENVNILNGHKYSATHKDNTNGVLNKEILTTDDRHPGDFRIEDLYAKPLRKRTVSEENKENNRVRFEDKKDDNSQTKGGDDLKDALVQELKQRLE